jgi:hypothetical protein
MRKLLERLYKLLERLYIVQKRVWVREHNGRVIHTRNQKRLNPYNPLTYIFILICYAIAILMYGFVGYKYEIDSDFFKWQ